MSRATEAVLRLAAATITGDPAAVMGAMELADVAQLVALVDAPAWRGGRDAWLEVYGAERSGLAVHEEDLGLGEVVLVTEGRADDPADGDLVEVKLKRPLGSLVPTLTVGGSARTAIRRALRRPDGVRVRVRVEVLERPAGAGGRAA